MNLKEMYEICIKVYKENEWDYDHFGVRFEDKERAIGEICEYSKDNPDRVDEREFPEYGTPEYNELPELDGTSAWYYDKYEFKAFNLDRMDLDLSQVASKCFNTKHAYIVAGNRLGDHPCSDEGEILLQDAKILAKLF